MRRAGRKAGNLGEREALAAEIERDLVAQYGPILSGEILRRYLGYRSAESWRQAIIKNTTPVRVFTIENRRGRHALSGDVAKWLAALHFEDGKTAHDAEGGASSDNN